MKTLTFEVSDALYEAFEQTAAKYERTLEEVALEWLANHSLKPRSPSREEEIHASWERLLSHAGAVGLGYPTGADNEGIDADLMREYGNTEEEKA